MIGPDFVGMAGESLSARKTTIQILCFGGVGESAMEKTGKVRMYSLFASIYFVEGLVQTFLVAVFLWRLAQAKVVGAGEIGESQAFAMIPWLLKPVFAILVDRSASKVRWIFGGSLLMVVLILLLPLIDGSVFAVVAGMFLAINLAVAMTDVPADGLAVQLVPEKDRGFVQTVENIALYLGKIVGGSGALMLLHWKVEWSVICSSIAVIVAVFGIGVPRWLKLETNQTPQAKGEKKQFAWKEFREFIKASQTVWAMLVGLLGTFAAGFSTPAIMVLLTEKLKFSNADYAIMNFGDPFFQIGGVVVAGVVARYASKSLSVGIGMVLCALPFIVLGIYNQQWSNHSFIFGMSWASSFGLGFAFVALMKLFMDFSDKRLPALSFVVFATMVNLCNFASPLAGGWMTKYELLPIDKIFVFGGFVQLLALVPLALIGRKRK